MVQRSPRRHAGKAIEVEDEGARVHIGQETRLVEALLLENKLSRQAERTEAKRQREEMRETETTHRIGARQMKRGANLGEL